MEDFVTFEIAKKLKGKGFPQNPDYFNYSSYYDWDGLRKIHSLANASVWFDPNINRDNIYFAPTIEQAFKWLRNNKKTMISILPVAFNEKENKFFQYYCSIYYATKEFTFELHERPGTFETYEECALEAIEYIIDKLI